MVTSSGDACEATQKALQAVAQGTRWTYSLLWQLCPHQGALVWAEGHYNGAIKTRKTVQPGGHDDDGGGEEAGSGNKAARKRSRQLRELYDSLAGEAAAAAGGGVGGGEGSSAAPARRPCASLAPEDLAETEWFYLMCGSYCFPPGLGLPGKAYATRRHVWLSGANQADSKVFLRAILAKSAGIQTVACIPVADDVLEIGTTEKVEEDIGLVQYARSIFMDQHGGHIHMVPTLSGHSTSSPIVTHIDDTPLHIKWGRHTAYPNVHPHHNLNPENKPSEDEDDAARFDTECVSDLEAKNEKGSCWQKNFGSSEQAATPNPGSSGLMHVGVSDGARYGCSSYVDEDVDGERREEGPGQWDLLYENLCCGYLEPSAEDQAIPPENAHYAETVLRILRHNADRQTASCVKTHLTVSTSSSFSRWNPKRPAVDLRNVAVSECAPQRMLKSILFINVGSSRCKFREAPTSPPEARDVDGEGTSRTRRGQQGQAELSASHVLKERRRREKLNERFVVLRSLVPFVTKMDRASILGDTIEYVKQLRRRIQDLESRPRLMTDTAPRPPPATSSHETRGYSTRAGTWTTRAAAAEPASDVISCSTSSAAAAEVQVSIIESDALVEVRCPHRDGLLLRVLQAVHRDLRMEVTSVQASSAGGALIAELRAKVKEVHGRRSSIAEVKRSIHLILSSSD